MMNLEDFINVKEARKFYNLTNKEKLFNQEVYVESKGIILTAETKAF